LRKRIPARLEWWRVEPGGKEWLDRERMRGWALGHALVWAFAGDDVDPAMVACARWFAEAA
jgi:hypothetical protein